MSRVALTQAPETDPTRLYRYRDGIYAGDLVIAALVHLDFFTWLAANPSSPGDICHALGLAPRPLDVMLTLFAANGFVVRDADTVRVTTTAREHLVDGSPFNLRPYFASLAHRPAVTDFLTVLRTGQPARWDDRTEADWHRAMEDDTFARAFTSAMDCRGAYLAQHLARQVPLESRARLLDIGGGSGIYACVLAAHNPSLEAIVFDRPPVDRLAAARIAEHGMSDRVHVEAGSFFTSPWPSTCDVHLFSNVLHDWDDADVAHLIARSFEALTEGGLLVIHDAFIDEDKTGPLPVAEYSTFLMHSTRGKCYSTGEYAERLTAAGFTSIAFSNTAADRGVMTALKPR